MKKTSPYYLAGMFFLFFILMLLDAHFTRLFSIWDHGNNLWQSQFLLLVMLFSSTYLSKRYMICTAILIGILFDLYYLSLIGVYAVALPLVVWAMYIFKTYYFQNVLTLFFSWIISLTLVQVIVLSIQLLFKLNVFQLQPFVVHSFGPTLLLNILMFCVFILPFKKLFKLDIPFFLTK